MQETYENKYGNGIEDARRAMERDMAAFRTEIGDVGLFGDFFRDINTSQSVFFNAQSSPDSPYQGSVKVSLSYETGNVNVEIKTIVSNETAMGLLMMRSGVHEMNLNFTFRKFNDDVRAELVKAFATYAKEGAAVFLKLLK